MRQIFCRKRGLTGFCQTALEPGAVDAAVRTYKELSAISDSGVPGHRPEYANVVNHYYDLVTDFYEYGWGDAFHFAPRFRNETLRESLLRHEHYLALCLALRAGETVLDVGCGIGGPMRNIARFAEVDVLGINNNTYQVRRANLLNAGTGLAERCRVIKADFMNMPLEGASIDKAYAIEATVHAPSLERAYTEIARVLKPGGLFATYEWCLTDRYNPADPAHRAFKDGILIGAGLPEIGSCRHVLDALEAAGFSILRAMDLAANAEIPWYEPLAPSRLTLDTFRSSPSGRKVTTSILYVLERLRIVPRGTTAVSQVLDQGAKALGEAGKAGIFTPMFLVVARKEQGTGLG